jgi:SAM-dependent methyltransferase
VDRERADLAQSPRGRASYERALSAKASGEFAAARAFFEQCLAERAAAGSGIARQLLSVVRPDLVERANRGAEGSAAASGAPSGPSDVRAPAAESEEGGPRPYLSERLSEGDIEQLYAEVVLTQDFYGIEYASDWTSEAPYAAVAGVIQRYFEPRLFLDVGCGLGLVVKHARALGIQGFGTDFSYAFLKHAPPGAREYCLASDVTTLPFGASQFDSVSCLEVLEHLPPRFGMAAIRELARIARGPILVTIPSYGPNRFGPAGLPLNDGSWLSDARAGRNFRNIVMFEGKPHCGHVTLATFEWWTNVFLWCGLNRCPQIEVKVNADRQMDVAGRRWNVYCLGKVSDGRIGVGDNEWRQLGSGWVEVDEGERMGEEAHVLAGQISEMFLAPAGGEQQLCLRAKPIGFGQYSPVSLGVQVLQQSEPQTFDLKGSFHASLAAGQWTTVQGRIEHIEEGRPVRVVVTALPLMNVEGNSGANSQAKEGAARWAMSAAWLE